MHAWSPSLSLSLSLSRLFCSRGANVSVAIYSITPVYLSCCVSPVLKEIIKYADTHELPLPSVNVLPVKPYWQPTPLSFSKGNYRILYSCSNASIRTSSFVFETTCMHIYATHFVYFYRDGRIPTATLSFHSCMRACLPRARWGRRLGDSCITYKQILLQL